MNPNIKTHVFYVAVAAALAGAFALLCCYYADFTRLWYVDLAKPSFQPAAAVMYYAIPALFALLAIALYMLFTQGGIHGRALYIIALMLAFIALWSYIFFQNADIVRAFATLCIAFALGLYAIACTLRRNKWAVLPLLPAVVGVGYMCVCNYMLFMMN